MEEGEITTEKPSSPNIETDTISDIKSEEKIIEAEKEQEKCVIDEKLSESEKESDGGNAGVDKTDVTLNSGEDEKNDVLSAGENTMDGGEEVGADVHQDKEIKGSQIEVKVNTEKAPDVFKKEEEVKDCPKWEEINNDSKVGKIEDSLKVEKMEDSPKEEKREDSLKEEKGEDSLKEEKMTDEIVAVIQKEEAQDPQIAAQTNAEKLTHIKEEKKDFIIATKVNADKTTDTQVVESEDSQFEEKMNTEKVGGIQDTTETEEGELDDSGDEKEQEFTVTSQSTTEVVETKPLDSPKMTEKYDLAEVKDGVSRLDFGIDETRPEEEQLDYDEDELEERTRASATVSTEAPRVVEHSSKEKCDGEVDSASEGEIKSDDDGDFEEGETRDHPLDLPPEQRKICKFFEMGNCTWGDRCRYLHPGVNDKGNYDMFGERRKPRREHLPPFNPEHQHPPEPFWDEPPPFMAPPAAETAWEKGLRHAKELKRRAMQRKVQEPDFMQKREVLSLNVALNEDHDMEFVNHVPFTSGNKGFDPFQEAEDDEYATPTPEELRRHGRILRDRRRGGPPPPLRHPHEKDRRLPPPDHMMPPDLRRERRPPSPRHHAVPERYPPDMRRMSPRHPQFDSERDRRGNMSPNNPAFMQRPRGERKDYQDRPPFPSDPNQRHLPPNRMKDEKYSSDGSKGSKNVQNGGAGVGRSEQWNDPWARARPLTRGPNKSRDGSSSSSGSSSGSSSRSSSRSSVSSHSSFSGSSRSSSRSSVSSSFSSHLGSSRSPSPTKNAKQKKKVLTTAKQRNAMPGQQKRQTQAQMKPAIGAKPVTQVKSESGLAKPPKSSPLVVKKIPDKKAVSAIPANSTSNLPKQTIVKRPLEKPTKVKKRTSSSSSEFSHSSDSSPSPSRAKSGSDSDSASSSGSSSSYSSSSGSSSESDEEDKPRNRRKVKPTNPTMPKGQILIAPPGLPTLSSGQSQQNTGKVMVPSKPGRKDVKMTIIEKSGVSKKRSAGDMTGQQKKPSSRRTELLEQLRAVEDAIARKRAKLT